MFSTSASPGIRMDQFLPSSFTTRIPHFPSQKNHPKPLDFTPNWRMGWEFPSYFFWGEGSQLSLLEGTGEGSLGWIRIRQCLLLQQIPPKTRPRQA